MSRRRSIGQLPRPVRTLRATSAPLHDDEEHCPRGPQPPGAVVGSAAHTSRCTLTTRSLTRPERGKDGLTVAGCIPVMRVFLAMTVRALTVVRAMVESRTPLRGPRPVLGHRHRAPRGRVCRREGGRDRGSGTVAVLGVVGVLLAMTVGALTVVSAVVASHRAQSAADLAALAVGAALVAGEGSGVACGRGVAVAARNGGSVTSCQTAPDLSVELVVDVPATMPRLGAATAYARAGPATSGAQP